MLNQQHPILNSLDPCVEPLLKRVLQAERLGVYCGLIELDSVSSSTGKAKGDRFKLSVPYAGQNLIWDVLFDSQCPGMGPDFRFGDDSFLANPDVETLPSIVPSLVTWDPSNNDALLNVLIELLSHYKQHQINLLAKQGERLQLEYSTLICEREIRTDDVEMILLPIGSKPTEARFLIRMAVDLSQLPTRNNKSQNDMAVLQVTFYGPDWNRIVPQLYLSKGLEEILGGQVALHIPPFTPDKYLMDYVPEVNAFINEKINAVVVSYEKRKNFITALVVLQRGSIVEYDATDFSRITILLEHRDFHFFVHFQLPTGFPREIPIVTLQSVYHITPQGKLYTETLENVPYSPRWEPSQMVTKILTYIMENAVSKFQNSSVKNNRL